VARRIQVPSEEWSAFGGLRVQETGPALVDTLTWLRGQDADRLFAWALARDLAPSEAFARWTGARRGRRGTARLRLYERMAAAGAGSAAEILFHDILESHGVRGWKANQQVRLVDGSLARPDALRVKTKRIVEIDGHLAHSSPDDLQRDRDRQNALEASGYRVLRLTWEDLVERPGRCADLARAWFAG
jgi:very-short-patch-repair endonuclease